MSSKKTVVQKRLAALKGPQKNKPPKQKKPPKEKPAKTDPDAPATVEKDLGGRPWFDGKDEESVLSKLREVWMVKGTDVEAALNAEISVSALQRYYDVHPELKEFRERLKATPKLAARKTVVKGLDDWEQAWAFLRREAKDEYGDEPTIQNNISVDLGAEAKARMVKYEKK